MREYLPRIYDPLLKKRVRAKGAVLVEGAKWCGKTTTCERLAESAIYLQDPSTKAQNIRLAEIAPLELLRGATPRLIDEWQLAPQLWDAVRFKVDHREEFGQFILTGSAVPPDPKKMSHTGTGRIARMKMRPMSLYESGDSTGAVSLSALFAGEQIPLRDLSAAWNTWPFYFAEGDGLAPWVWTMNRRCCKRPITWTA